MSKMKKMLMTLVISAMVAASAAPIDDSDWRGGPSDAWFVNWDKALAEAKKKNKNLFVLNTGSDWCHWCKKLKAEVLDKPEFNEFAAKNLVLVYLDNPSRNPLGKAQKMHNRQIVKTLAFSGGVPNACVFSAKGKKLGTIGGGGLAVDAYLERLKKILLEKGQYFGDDDARTLFAEGYGKLAEAIAAARAKLPPVTKDDFKARLTGVAIVDRGQRNDYNSAKFVPPETPLEVPFGKTALFRVEYDFPEGYGARVWTRDDWPGEQRRNSYNFGSNPSGFYKGKGTAYGFLLLLERGSECTLESLKILTNADPELDEYPRGWEISKSPVRLNFKAKDGTAATEEVKEEKPEPVEPYVSKGKLHAAYRSKDRKRVFVEVSHTHVCDSFTTPPFTLDRVREAISLKVDVLLIVLACTKDGVLFSSEREGLENISTGTGSAGDYTAAQFKRLKVKQYGNITPRGFATLEDILKMGKGKILFKLSGAFLHTKELESLLSRLNAWESVIVEGWDIREVRSKCTEQTWKKIRSGELQIMVGNNSLAEWERYVPECSVWGWNGKLEEIGLKDVPHLVNVAFVYGAGDAERTDDEAGWERALRDGAAVFRTNRPKELGKFLKKQKRR